MKKLAFFFLLPTLMACATHSARPLQRYDTVRIYVENNTGIDIQLWLDRTWIDNIRHNEVMTITLRNMYLPNSRISSLDMWQQTLGRTRPRNLQLSPCWHLYIYEGGTGFGDFIHLYLEDDGTTCLAQ
jgi:hypothetical protein